MKSLLTRAGYSYVGDHATCYEGDTISFTDTGFGYFVEKITETTITLQAISNRDGVRHTSTTYSTKSVLMDTSVGLLTVRKDFEVL